MSRFLRVRGGAVYLFMLGALSPALFAQCPTVDANGICILGLASGPASLIGPLTPIGSNPWSFSDLAEVATANNMVPAALAEAPVLGTPLAGTFSWTSGFQTITTSADQTAALAGKSVVVITWTTVDGPGTGRLICPIQSVTSTVITCSENIFEPSSSGQLGYLMPPPDSNGLDYQAWTVENPTVAWNYYDVAIALYRLYYRTNNAAYLTQARQYVDITWQWTLDHGYRSVAPRASTMLSQFFRVSEGHTERLAGLYNWITTFTPRFIDPSFSPNFDTREGGYALWDNVSGAKIDTDPTRHAAYCSAISTNTAKWNAVQNPDGSFSEADFSLNASFVDAPKSFTAPIQFGASPWRVAIVIKGLEAAYESLSDTSSQGCNNPTLAAATLTTITNAVIWQWNYGRDTSNRGIYYEVNSQSDAQLTITASGTVSINLSSTAALGVGTNWNTAGYCDGTHFIGFYSSSTVYKIASCADNTHATLSVPFGLYGESSNLSGSGFGVAPAAATSCHSSATYCGSAGSGTNPGDRNLTRVVIGDIGWLYGKTLNPTYAGYLNEFLSAQMGGPTSGVTQAAGIGDKVLPCSGPACDGYVPDTFTGAPNCTTTGGTPPCLGGTQLYSNLGKNYGECFGAPGCDNGLAYRLLGNTPVITSTSPLPNGTVGVSYSFQFTATGTTPITWSGTGLPSWATLSPSGLLSGTPTLALTSTIPIIATNANGSAGPMNFSLTVVSSLTAPTITSTSPLPGGTIGVPYSYSFTASGTTPITWSATGLPSWASLSSAGLLTGTPPAAATATFNVTATNTVGSAGPSPFSLTVSGGAGPTCSPKTHLTPPTATDIQLQTNMGLAVVSCTNSLTGSGCSVVDVQRVVNASLPGGTCVVGP